MKAQIYVNRHIVAATLSVVDAKEGELRAGGTLIEDANKAQGLGATIWRKTTFDSLVVDGVAANRAMFDKEKDDR